MNSNSKDRRSGRERRAGAAAAEVEADSVRKRERRMGDRRESPRLPIKILVRQVDLGGSFEERDGDIAVGGVYFEDRHTPPGRKVELRFRLPGREKEIRCAGEIIRVSEGKGRYGAHVRFVDLSTDVELAVARFIDDQLAKKEG